jgi:hypothetical protein
MLEMFAGLYRTRTDDLNGFAIREAASAVCGALDPVVYLNDVRRVYSLEEKAALLRASLASVGPEFADLDPAFLVDLLRRYTPKKPASGRLTAAGIVAELLIKTGAMGASRSDSTVNRQRVLDRVTKAIRARRRA